MKNTRTNIKLIPSQGSIENINGIYKKMHISEFLAEPHLTIIYSNTIYPIDKINPPMPIGWGLPIITIKSRLKLWNGLQGDGLCMGIVFDSPELQLLHTFLKETYDLKTSFNHYMPHITIVKNTRKFCYFPKIDFPILFDKLVMDNGR